MKVLVNAINLSSAGGLSVAKNFFNHLAKFTHHEFIVVVPEDCGYEEFGNEINVRISIVDKKWTSYFGRLFFDYFLIKKRLSKENPDVIFTMGNFAVPTHKYRQLVFFAWPYGVYPEAIKELDFSFKQKVIQQLRLLLFVSRLKFATKVASQTEVDKLLLEEKYPFLPSVSVVPNAYSIISIGNNTGNYYHFLYSSDKKNLLCLARYYLHKNIEILIEVAKIFKARRLAYRIVLTLDSKDHPNALKIINSIKEFKLEEYIINIGSQPLAQISELYQACDGLVLPSLLEAYSTTYADCLFLGKPIFTSDRKFAHGVCQDAAFYFDPYSPEDITKIIDKAFVDKGILTKKISIGKLISNSFPNWEGVTSMYIKLLEELHETDTTIL